jgi:signal transduction histidine kinase
MRRRPSLAAAWPYAVAAALVGLAFVPSVAPLGIELTELSDRTMDPLGWFLLTAQGALVALAGRWPVASLVTVGAAFIAYQLRGYPTTFASLGLFVVASVVAYRGPRHPRVVLVSALVAFTAFVIAARAIGSPSTVLDFISFGVLTAVLVVVAVWLRMQSAQRAARMRDAEREAVDAERARIARELHDVVTHHVTAMVVQSDALQRVTGDPDRLETGLKAIGETGRSALGDLRDLFQTLALQDLPNGSPSS